MRLFVISNRVPSPDARTGAGGLAVALRDALSESGGVWFGWSGRQAADRQAEPSVVTEDNIAFTTVDLTAHDFVQFYSGYANSVLWPLFHEQLHAMEFRESFRDAYQDVNAYFAEVAAPRIEPGDVVWVHDYQLIPLGAELRSRGVAGRLGFFLHIPFPPFDVFRALPEHRRLLRAFLAYDLVGFQTASDVGTSLTPWPGAWVPTWISRKEKRSFAGRALRFAAFPIGIDVDATAQTALTNRASRHGQRLTRALRGRKLADRRRPPGLHQGTGGTVPRLRDVPRAAWKGLR